ncbi:MAG: metallophosphoesterase [Pirellula sp.]
MKIVWLTDIHLVFLRDPKSGVFDAEYFAFIDLVSAHAPDGVFITGDIGEAPETVGFLEDLAKRWSVPIYFVLGNHDFYRSSIAEMRGIVDSVCGKHPLLKYLTASGPIELTSEVGLVGHDGWTDGRDGDYGCDGKQNFFNDFKYIKELRANGPDPDFERWPILKRLADEAANHIELNMVSAAERYKRVFVLTHFPPFRQVAFLNGRMVDAQEASRSVSKAVGDAIIRVAERNPSTHFSVLCGHMHCKATYDPRENLRVMAGGATYGSPEVSAVFEI